MTDKDYTHLALVVDRSGSMMGLDTDMNGAIRKLLSDQAKEPGTCVVDIITFDNRVEFPFTDVRPDDVKVDIIHPRGSTALNDAIGLAIHRLGDKFAAMEEKDRPGTVVVVIVTDGMENASREYTHDQIKALVTEQTEKWNWSFVYLAANVDAFATGSTYGFDRGSTIAYAASTAGTQNVYDVTSSNISALRTNNSRGVATAGISFSDEEREEAMEQ